MRRVDYAPALIESDIVDKPFHRACAEYRNALVYFALLLGRVDMDRPFRGGVANSAQRVKRHRTQRMRRDAEARVRQGCQDCADAVEELEEAFRIIEAAPLGRGRSLPPNPPNS